MGPKKEAELLDELQRVAAAARARARESSWDGRENAKSWRYITRCTRIHLPTRTAVIFTRDVGHHTSGWMKNPDYERCEHLSLSPAPPLIVTPEPQVAELNPRIAALWALAFFGENVRHIWSESAKTPEGRARGVEHYRVFCDQTWTPITPRGEVYSTELTEKGWRSWSELGHVVISSVDPT